MAWAIGTPVNVANQSGSTINLPCSITVAAGDAIKVFTSFDSSSGVTSGVVDDNLFSTTYNRTESIIEPNSSQAIEIHHLIAPGAGTITNIRLRFNPTPGTTTAGFVEVVGVKATGSDASSIFDGGDKQALNAPGAGVDAVATNNFTTTVNGDLIVCACVNTTTGADLFTIGTGFTLIDRTAFATLIAEFRVQAAAGAIKGTFTDSSGGTSFFGIAADSLTPAGGGGTGAVPRKTIRDVASWYEEEQYYYYRNALLFKPHGGAAGPPVPFKQGKTFQVLNYFEPDFFDYTRAVVQSGKRPGIIPGFPRKTFQNNSQATFDAIAEQDFSNYYGGKLSVPRIAATAGFPRKTFQNQSAIAFQEIDNLNFDAYYGVKISKPSHGGSGASPRHTFQNISQACFDLSPETYDQYYGVKVAKPHIGPPPGPTTGVINKFGYVGNGDRVG